MVKKKTIGLILLIIIALFLAAISCQKITIDPTEDPTEPKKGKTPDNSDTISGDTVLIGG